MENEGIEYEVDLCSEKKRIEAIQSDVSYLKDLFTRRLLEDKQKTQLIEQLKSIASYASVEPFLYDLILLIDRMERTNDDTAQSVIDELTDILERRGVKQIQVGIDFDPAIHKAVRITKSPKTNEMRITEIVRNGYTFLGRVIRPAEVCIEMGIGEQTDNNMEKTEQ